MGQTLPQIRSTALMAFLAVAYMCIFPVSAKDRVITGVIIGFDCGESPFLIVQDADGKEHEGACYEKWCERAAWEKKWCPAAGEGTDRVSRQYLGKTIRATVRRIMIEESFESYEGVNNDEFFNIEFLTSSSEGTPERVTEHDVTSLQLSVDPEDVTGDEVRDNRFDYELEWSDAMLVDEHDTGPINWMTYEETPRAYKGYIKLDESESVQNVRTALVRLREAANSMNVNTLLVYNFNSGRCGSGGCLLTILLNQPDGTMKEILSVLSGWGKDDDGQVGTGVSLGKLYTNGMRNLRFNNSVTWIWNGHTYVLK